MISKRENNLKDIKVEIPRPRSPSASNGWGPTRGPLSAPSPRCAAPSPGPWSGHVTCRRCGPAGVLLMPAGTLMDAARKEVPRSARRELA